MKTACYIISLLVVLLSLVPCKDSLAPADNDQINLVSSAQSDQADDFCSPFCQCTCCTTPTVNNFTIPAINLVISGEFNYAEHLPGDVLETHLSIWQPPKIS